MVNQRKEAWKKWDRQKASLDKNLPNDIKIKFCHGLAYGNFRVEMSYSKHNADFVLLSFLETGNIYRELSVPVELLRKIHIAFGVLSGDIGKNVAEENGMEVAE